MMATALPSAIMTTPNYNHHAAASNQCIDPEDFFDFGQHASPQAATLKREASATSSIATPTNASLDDDLQTPAKPSHEYERFKQQTGLPTGSIAGLSYNPGYMFSSTGIDEMAMMGDSSSMMNPGWGTGLGIDANMNMGMDMQQPAFFFPNDNGHDDFIDPSSIVREEPAQVRVWPGMHQQQAALAKAQAQQAAAAQAQAQQQRQQQFALQRQQQAAAQQSRAQQQQQQRRPAARKPSSPIDDARTAETIARVVATIRAESQNAANAMNDGSQNVLPNIIRAKKDEDDMDDDERLLASEEGKKLTSKERRQLRNKVSARAFRSRRKEYIGQLEGEVNQKVNEANELRNENRLLMEENARSRAFIERLLSHRAFAPYLEELSREEALQPQNMAPPSTIPSAPASQNQQFNGNTHVGMTLVPDTQLDMSMLNINGSGSWGSGSGFNFNQPQVFAVHELPEGPVNPLDTQAMSGKGYSAIFRAEDEHVADTVKPDFPIVQNPMPTEAPQMAATADLEDYEDDLYSVSPVPSTSSPAAPLENHATLFTNPEKALTHVALVVADEAEDVRLAERLERRLAAMEPALQRVAALTSMLDL